MSTRIIDAFIVYFISVSPISCFLTVGIWCQMPWADSFGVQVACLQLVYCLLTGGFPFNSFLGGFFSCLGMAVTTGV